MPRSRKGEASDVAIEGRLRCLARTSRSICPALLTTDTDFLGVVQEIVGMGREMVVLVPQGRTSSMRKYELAGARVLPMQGRGNGPKVRAQLHAHGGGSVEMTDPWAAPQVSEDDREEPSAFLQSLDYRDERGYLVQSVAKFWFTHRLGPVTVFPVPQGCAETFQLVRKAGAEASWVRYKDNLAYFLPVTGSSKKTLKKIDEFGGMVARQIFKGGGPFVIHDSPDMVAQALSMMGYLDYKLNADVAEAMLTFVNMPENKLKLRKYCDALPSFEDTISDVSEKLRRAFLSHGTDGLWRLAPKDAEVRKELCKQGLLTSEASTKSAVLQAMIKFARQHKLPEMRSYNGYLFRILHHMGTSDPSRVGTVEFKV